MRAIPVPVRERILKLYDDGETTAEIAELLGYCVAAVRRVRQQFQARGTLQPKTHLWPNAGRSGRHNWRSNPPPGWCSWMKVVPTPK